MTQADPVSWFLIEPGWTVVDASGDHVGSVNEVVGDSGADIFNGLSVSAGLLHAPRYVPAESVKTITEGTVQLSLSKDDVKQLDAYEEPPPSEEIGPS